MAEIVGFDDVWNFFTPKSLLEDPDFSGLLIFDTDDEEIPLTQFKAVERYWRGAESVETNGLGHHLILKDAAVIENVLQFMNHPLPYPSAMASCVALPTPSMESSPSRGRGNKNPTESNIPSPQRGEG